MKASRLCSAARGVPLIEFIIARYYLSDATSENLFDVACSAPRCFVLLHTVVIRAAATLRGYPSDDLVGVGDVAGLAVDAVREVDLQALRLRRFRLNHLPNHLIDCGWAEVLAWVPELCSAAGVADIEVGNDQMSRLIVFVTSAGMVDVGKPVEGQLAVALSIAEKSFPAVGVFSQGADGAHFLVTGAVGEIRAKIRSAQELLDPRLDDSVNQAMFKALMEIAD